jgi:membrane-associated protein
MLIGFFLPGDSMLFTVGVVAGAGELPIVPTIVLLTIASILGDGCGFWLGGTLGYSLFQRPGARIFRREHLERTHEFYERHGGKTIVLAKFLPIIRTFAAFIAGVGKMRYSRFILFNLVGAAGWVTSMITLGYLLGNVPIVRRNFQTFVLAIIVVSLIPAVSQALKGRRKSAPIIQK